MSLLEKPKDLYAKELPKIGRDANPKLSYNSEIEKLNMLQILFKGLNNEEMDPKHYKRYDNFLTNFKVYGLTAVVGFGLFYIVFNSSVMSGPASEAEKTLWLDKVFNNFIDVLVEYYDKFINLF